MAVVVVGIVIRSFAALWARVALAGVDAPKIPSQAVTELPCRPVIADE